MQNKPGLLGVCKIELIYSCEGEFYMQEPEVSLRIAMKYIESGETLENITISIDGAHIKTKDTIHFDIIKFLGDNGFVKFDNDISRWQGEYVHNSFANRIIISSKPGVGDVVINLTNGKTLYIESKKFKNAGNGEYSAMREAIGQLMTGCPNEDNIIPVVAVPYSTKSMELAQRWSQNKRIAKAGICFILVHNCGKIDFI